MAKLVGALALRAANRLAISPALIELLRNSAQWNYLEILVDEVQRPIGYVSFARINKSSLERLARTGCIPKYDYEWNEGRIVLVLDVLIVAQARVAAIRQFRALLQRHRVVVAHRRAEPLKIYLRHGHHFVRMRRPQSASRTREDIAGSGQFDVLQGRLSCRSTERDATQPS
jgi:hemolysin-activating ACP:hemolysin acyltransferase